MVHVHIKRVKWIEEMSSFTYGLVKASTHSFQLPLYDAAIFFNYVILLPLHLLPRMNVMHDFISIGSVELREKREKSKVKNSCPQPIRTHNLEIHRLAAGWVSWELMKDYVCIWPLYIHVLVLPLYWHGVPKYKWKSLAHSGIRTKKKHLRYIVRLATDRASQELLKDFFCKIPLFVHVLTMYRHTLEAWLNEVEHILSKTHNKTLPHLECIKLLYTSMGLLHKGNLKKELSITGKLNRKRVL